MTKVNLEYIVDHFQNCLENLHVFVDKNQGELEAVMNSAMECAKNGNEPEEEWLLDQVRVAKEILMDKNNERFVKLPEEKPLDDFELIEGFAYSLENQDVKNEIINFKKQKESYGKFIGILEREDLFDKWYNFEDEEYFKAAVKWCKENNIEFK